jgi:hypothetical protein
VVIFSGKGKGETIFSFSRKSKILQLLRIRKLKILLRSFWMCQIKILKPSSNFPETPPPVIDLYLLSAFSKSIKKLKTLIPILYLF